MIKMGQATKRGLERERERERDCNKQVKYEIYILWVKYKFLNFFDC
jgi:hypothetical protein